MAECITKGISRIVCSSLHCFRHPSILYPYLGTSGRGVWNNVFIPQRNKGITTSGHVTKNGGSGRKGIVDQNGLVGALRLEKLNKKPKSKGKLYKENGSRKNSIDVFSTSTKSKQTKATKTATNNYGSFINSLNAQQRSGNKMARKNKSLNPQIVTQMAQTSTLPRLINSSRIVTKDLVELSRSGNSVLTNTDGFVFNVGSGNQSGLKSGSDNKTRSKKSKGFKRISNKKKDSLDDIKWFPNREALYNSKFLGLDRMDIDITGSKTQVDERPLPIAGFKIESVFESQGVNKIVNESKTTEDLAENGSKLKRWSPNLPITGYDDLLMKEKQHRLSRNDTGFGVDSKPLVNSAESSLDNDLKVEIIAVSANDVSKGFILVDNEKYEQLSNNGKHQLSEENLKEDVEYINSTNFSKNVDELIKSLEKDCWDSQVGRNVEVIGKSEQTTGYSMNGENDFKSGDSLPTALTNSPSAFSQVDVRELTPDVVESGLCLSKKKRSKDENLSYAIIDCSHCSGPVLSVRPDEIISKGRSLNNLSVTCLDSAERENLSERVMSSVQLAQAQSKTLQDVWSSSEKLLELRKKKLGTALGKSPKIRDSKNKNNALTKLDTKEFDLARELKETYRDQFRERFQQMMYDQRMKQRLGALPSNTLVYTPNSQANWIADLTAMARQKVELGSMNKYSKKQLKKLRSKRENKELENDTMGMNGTKTETPWTGSLMSFKKANSEENGCSEMPTVRSWDEKVEDFIKERDEKYHREILSQKNEYPSTFDDPLTRRMSQLDGLVTMEVERVYDDKPSGKVPVKIEKSNNQKAFEQLVMNRYKQALRRYQERQQKEREDRNKRKKNKNNIGHNKYKKNKPNLSKGKLPRGSGSRHNVDN